jgi:hypothetical protein
MGIKFGLTAGLSGGFLWALITWIVPEEALIAPRWTVLSVGFLFWFFVGFLVGVSNVPRVATQPVLPVRARPSYLERMLDAVGWFCYRLVVGSFVGIIATLAFTLVGITPWFVAALFFLQPAKILFDSPEGRALECAIIASQACGCSGGIFGALLAYRRFPPSRPAVGTRAARSSFLAFLIGLPFGVSLGWLPPTDTRWFVFLIASVPIGILAGILGGVWTDVRARTSGGNLHPPHDIGAPRL